jgi:polyhydroxyalkanoate synthesis regulator phasin
MKTWITVKNGRISNIRKSSGDNSPDKDWIEVPQNFMGRLGDKWPEWFDNGRRINDDILVKSGKRKDMRGRWYHKEKIGETTLIYGIDETIDETEYTKEAPIGNEPYQKFDNKKNKWVIETEKKARAEKENKLGRLKSEINDAEQRQIRPMKAIMKNEATNADTETFDRCEEIIQTLRPQISELENELKMN